MTNIVEYTSRDGKIKASIDIEKLPSVSQTALYRFGVAHFCGNVMQAKLVSEVRDIIKNDRGYEKASSVSAEEVTRWRAMHKDEVTKMWQSYVNEGVQDLLDGNVGMRAAPKPKVIDVVAERVKEKALDYVLMALKDLSEKQGRAITLPEDENEAIGWGTNSDGTPRTRTRGQLIANAIASQGDKLRVMVLREMAEEAERAAQAAPEPEDVDEYAGL